MLLLDNFSSYHYVKYHLNISFKKGTNFVMSYFKKQP